MARAARPCFPTKVRNAPLNQIVSQQEIAVQGYQAIEVVWVTRRPDGTVCKTWARVLVNGSCGYITIFSTLGEEAGVLGLLNSN